MKRILLGIIGVLVLANIIQFCSSGATRDKLELKNQQFECVQKCMQ